MSPGFLPQNKFSYRLIRQQDHSFQGGLIWPIIPQLCNAKKPGFFKKPGF